jgi:predicted phosphate transport protein (TIGR00153 family)
MLLVEKKSPWNSNGGKNKMAKKSFAWFEDRNRIEVMNLAQKQIEKALGTVVLLKEAIAHVVQKDTEKARNSVEKLFKEEEAVDELRQSVFRKMTNTAISIEFREDFMHLVKRLDVMADHIKDAARCVALLLDRKIPEELWKAYASMTEEMVRTSEALRLSIEQLSSNADTALQKAKEIEQFENQIDKQHFEIRKSFPRYTDQIDPSTLLLLNELAGYIEEASDVCADTADYISMLAGEK